VSGDALDYLQEFTVTANTTASSSAIAALPIYPAIKFGSTPQKTVSAQPTSSAALVLKSGTVSTGYPMNIAYHKHAFCYAMAELEMPKGVHFGARQTDEETGLSIRIVSDYQIKTDEFITRCDIAYGWAARRPEWSCVLRG
jgi:hypothetical protein